MTVDIENEEWRGRLAAAIADAGMSLRAVSLKAGLGPGALHSWLTEGKSPSIDNLLSVCGVLGVSLSYIAYGYKITPQAEEILTLLEANPAARDGILQILKAQRGS